VYLPDGTGATGNLIATWPAFVTARGTFVAGGSTTATLGADGALNVALVPNAGATPAGVYYTVVYRIGSRDGKTEYWIVPATFPTNLATKGSALTRIDAVAQRDIVDPDKFKAGISMLVDDADAVPECFVRGEGRGAAVSGHPVVKSPPFRKVRERMGHPAEIP
jgi:hypothetical protein